MRGRRIHLASLVLTAAVFLGVLPTTVWAIKIADYNLLQYSSGRATELKIIMNLIQPDVLVVQEISSQSAVTYFLTNVLNAADGPGGYLAADFHDDGFLSNALFYRTSTITYAGASDHLVINTSPRDTDRWRLGLVGDTSGQLSFYVYGMHLDATDPDVRLAQTTAVRANANLLPAGSHFLYCGDFNIDSSTEPSYQQFVGSQADNDGRAWDPINSPGTWGNNPSFASIHTQCPHEDNPGAPGGAVGGGMDDRFDFILVSSALFDAQGFDYVSGTYKAFGNDGLHYNNDINDPPALPNPPYPPGTADALHAASDHLPVALELTAPPVLVVPSSLGFGTMIVGASSPNNERVLTVQNGATPPALDLNYTFSTVPTPYSVLGGTGPFTLTAGSSQPHTIALSTANAGFFNANLVISNNASPPNKNVFLFGTVKNHAVPSTDGISQVLTAPLDFGSHPVGGFTDQNALIYNVGYGALQSLLQVYAANVTGDPRFSIVGFAPVNVLGTPASFAVHFDDTAAPPGAAYTATLEFSTRDDTTLTGWSELAAVSYDLSAFVEGLRGDFDFINGVDPADIPPFIDVLLDPAGATPTDRWIADMTADETNDAADIPLFVDALIP